MGKGAGIRMDTHDHSNLFIHWIAGSWQFIVMLGTAVVGGLFFYARFLFTTKKETKKCKEDIAVELKSHEVREEKRLDEIIETNADAHDKIWAGQERLHSDVQWIKNHLISRNGDE